MTDVDYMRLALAHARKGLGRTSPNPTVGAVVVKHGQVVGVGHHRAYGAPHAEAVALAQAGARARGATLFTTLEPCDHFGKTPPCSEAIVRAGIRRVVYGSDDPNPLVNGRGLRKLKRAGVQTVPHVLREEADELNLPFFSAMTRQRPWVTLKCAVSLDGSIATSTGNSQWISSPQSRVLVHALRDAVDAIVVGRGTVEADDPRLTTRLERGRGHDAARIVLDTDLKLSPRATIVRQRSTAPTVVVTTASLDTARARALARAGAQLWNVPEKNAQVDVARVLELAWEAGWNHVMLEGGSGVYASFLRAGLVDEIWMFMGPLVLGHDSRRWTGDLWSPTVASAPRFEILAVDRIGPDLCVKLRPAITAARRAESRSRPRSRSRAR